MKKFLYVVVALLCMAGSLVVAQDTIGTTKLWSGDPRNFNEAIFSHNGAYVFGASKLRGPIIKYDALTGQALDTLPDSYSRYDLNMNILPGDSILVYLKEFVDTDSIHYNVPTYHNLNTHQYKIYDSSYKQKKTFSNGFMFNKNYTKYAQVLDWPSKLIQIYNASTHQKIKEFGYRSGIALDFVGWTSDSTILCSNWRTDNNNNNIYFGELYNVYTGKLQVQTEVLDSPIESNSISPDGKVFLSVRSIKSTDSLKTIKKLNNSDGLYAGLFDNTGNYIFFYSIDRIPKVYDYNQEKIICNSDAITGPLKQMNDSNNLIFSSHRVYRVNWDFITDVPEETFSKPSKIFPNPASTYLCIESDSEIENVELYDILGIRQKIVINNNTIKLIENMPKGIYFVKYDTNGKTYFDKVIIE